MKTKAIVFKTKKRIFGSNLGRNLSGFKGNGLDFREFREYTYGEDAKKIDWKASAKINRPLIKEYNEERELRIIIAVLKSGSLFFGSKKMKTELLAEIIATISLAAVAQDNRVQPVFLGREKKIFKPTKTEKNIYSYVQYALEADYLQEECTQKEIDFLNGFKKSLLFLIGDFFKPFKLHTLKHETYVINIRDMFEENPTFSGPVNIVDPVTLNSQEVNFTQKNIEKLKTHISRLDKKLLKECAKHKIPYTKIYTHEDPFYKILRLVK